MESYKGLHPRDGVKGQGTGRLQDHLCPLHRLQALSLHTVVSETKGRYNFSSTLHAFSMYLTY